MMSTKVNAIPAPDAQAPLFHRDFTLVVIGQIISLFGNNILRFALPLYIYYQSGSEALLGLVGACAFIPMVIMSPVGGIFADRVNKQRIMVVLDFITAALTLGFLLLSGRVALVPLVILMMMLLYGIQGAYSPAVQASLPVLASTDNLMSANAVVNLVNSLSSLLGPVLGGILYAAYGLMPLVAVSAVCFFLSAVMELFISIPHKSQPAGGSAWQIIKGDMRVSLRFITGDKPVMIRVLGIVLAVNLFMSSLIMIGLPVLITKTLSLSVDLYGYTQGFLAAGGLLGGLLAGVLGKKLALRHNYLLLAICGVGLIPIALTFLLGAPVMVCYVALTGISFLMMACATLFSIHMLAFVQVIAPGEIVGKVIACVMAISMCAQPLGQLLYGLLFQYLSAIPWTILLGGGLVTLGIALFSKKTFAALEE